MAESRRTSEAKRLRPFMAAAASGVAAETSDQDILALVASLNTHRSSADHDDRYFTMTETNSLLSDKADKTLGLTAGNGLTGGGDLSTNRTFNVGAGSGIVVEEDSVRVDTAADFDWAGTHRFLNDLTTKHLLPDSPDSYDLGSQQKPYRRAHVSEISSTIFTKNEQTIHDGWFVITKGSGKLNTAIDASATSVDLEGGGFVVGDRLIFRRVDETTGSPVYEVMTVASVPGSGTVYTLNRGAESSGADTWPAGQVFANYGKTGDGRIEMNSLLGTKQSIFQHGTTAAGDAEILRQGFMEGWDGAGLAGRWGWGVGRWNAGIGPYALYNQEDGLIVKGQVRADSGYLKDLSITGVLGLATTGRLQQGTGTWGTDFTGTALWNDVGIMNIGGWKAGVKQWWGGSDGVFNANSGKIKINENGIIGTIGGFDSNGGRLIYTDSYNDLGPIVGMELKTYQMDFLEGDLRTEMAVYNNLGGLAQINLSAEQNAPGAVASYVGINMQALPYVGSTRTIIGLTATETSISGTLTVTGLITGTVTQAQNADKLDTRHASTTPTANTIPIGNGTDGKLAVGWMPAGQTFVPLTTPLTSTAWGGNSFSTTAKTLIDLSTVFGVPAGVKAVLVELTVKDSGSLATVCLIGLAPNNTTNLFALCCKPLGNANDVTERTAGIVPCDANGDIYYQTIASGAATLDVTINIWGYWL